MKTIRTNCFETNSSSTHSITIDSRQGSPIDEIESLVENNVLYPARLLNEKVRDKITTRKHGQYDSTTTDRFRTKHAKAAVLVHYLDSLLSWDHGNDSKERLGKLFDECLELIAFHCGYDKILVDQGFWSAWSISEYSDDQYDDDFTLQDFIGNSISHKKMVDMRGLENFIINVVLNDEKIITDENSSY